MRPCNRNSSQRPVRETAICCCVCGSARKKCRPRRQPLRLEQNYLPRLPSPIVKLPSPIRQAVAPDREATYADREAHYAPRHSAPVGRAAAATNHATANLMTIAAPPAPFHISPLRKIQGVGVGAREVVTHALEVARLTALGPRTHIPKTEEDARAGHPSVGGEGLCVICQDGEANVVLIDCKCVFSAPLTLSYTAADSKQAYGHVQGLLRPDDERELGQALVPRMQGSYPQPQPKAYGLS